VFEHSRFAYIDLRKGVNVDEIMREVEIGPEESFTLHPGQLVLGMTIESLELPTDLLARLEGRSSLGRLGIIVHGTASVFDPGWIGNPTLELGNVGILPVSLYAGMRICSFTFETLSSPAEVPYTKKVGSKYAHQTSYGRFAAEKDIMRMTSIPTPAEHLTRPRVSSWTPFSAFVPVLDDGFVASSTTWGDAGRSSARVSYGIGTNACKKIAGLFGLLRHAHDAVWMGERLRHAHGCGSNGSPPPRT
jgi:dCTP deaminase